MKPLIIGMTLIVIGAVPAIPTSAQGSRDAGARQQVGCFRGRPLPACKSFWIFEMQGSSPIAQSSRTIRFSSGQGWSDRPQFSEDQLPAFGWCPADS